jgi:hypothetical protein
MANWYPTANRANLSPSRKPPLSCRSPRQLAGASSGSAAPAGSVKGGTTTLVPSGNPAPPAGPSPSRGGCADQSAQRLGIVFRPQRAARVPKGKAPAGRRRRMRTLATRPNGFKTVRERSGGRLAAVSDGRKATGWLWSGPKRRARIKTAAGTPWPRCAISSRFRPNGAGASRLPDHAPRRKNGGGTLRLDPTEPLHGCRARANPSPYGERSPAIAGSGGVLPQSQSWFGEPAPRR